MEIYLINFATVLDWECYLDDGGDSIDLEDLVMPRGLVITSLDRLPAAQEVAFKEMTDCDDKPPTNYQWLKVAMECPITGDDYQRYDLNVDGKLYGVMVIRKMEPV